MTTIIWTQESNNAGTSVLGRAGSSGSNDTLCHLCFRYVGSVLKQFLPNKSVLSETRMRTYASLIFPDMNLLACMLCPMLNQSLHPRECRADWPSLGWLGWERPSSPKYGRGQRGWEGSVSLRKTRMSLLREEWMETGQRKQQMATCPRFIASVLGKHLFNH